MSGLFKIRDLITQTTTPLIFIAVRNSDPVLFYNILLKT
jgi:hypothetical protein